MYVPKGNAGFTYTPSGGQETTLQLAAPLRDLTAREVKHRSDTWSVDLANRSNIVVGSGVYDLTATIRYHGAPQELLDFLAAGADGVTLTYYPDLAFGESYDCDLVHGDDAVEAALDRDLWFRSAFETRLTLRRTSGDWSALITGLLLQYEPGFNLADWTFARADVATYTDAQRTLQEAASGDLRDAHHVDDDGALVRAVKLERSATNKCHRTYLFGTNGTAGWTRTGDAAATLTAVSDAAELAAAGLDDLVSDDTVLKLDNSAGSSIARATNDGTVGNTNEHTASTYLRGSGTAQLAIGSQVGNVALGSSYARVETTETPGAGTDTLQVIAGAGAVVYFVLPQLEEAPVRSSVIPNDAAASEARAGETFSRSWDAGLVTFSAYTRFYEAGSAVDTGESHYIAQWGTVAAGRIFVYSPSGEDAYRAAMFRSGGTLTQTANTLTAPSIGQLVELLAQFEVDTDALTVRARLFQSLDGGTAEDSGWTSTVDADFGSALTNVYLNSRDGGSNAGLVDLRAFYCKRDLVTLAKMRSEAGF